MKIVILSFLLSLSFTIYAQKECEYSTNITDSLGNYKTTKDYLLSEKKFGNNSEFVFISLVNAEGQPAVSLQIIQKSNEFITADCFDKNSKIYLQLFNGKIITLYHLDAENCGNLLVDDKNNYNRVLTGYFLFPKGYTESLIASKMSLMRIKFSTNTKDIILKDSFVSEMDNKTYYPENYFIDYLKCIE
jgi:hypothetical protein